MNNRSLPNNLSIASISMLLAFLVYWNLVTYKNNKRKLIEDVQNQMALSYADKKDKLLLKSMVSLGAEDKHNVSVHLNNNVTDVIENIQASDSTKEKNYSEIWIDTKPETKFPHIRQDLPVSASNLPKDSIVVLLRTLVKHSEKEDSTFVFYLKKRMMASGLPSSFLIPKDSVYPARGITILYHPNSFFEDDQTILMTGYQLYLLRKQLPFFLISLLLIGSTAVAFWLMWSTAQKSRELVAIKNNFISNVAHELKTPVSTVNVTLEAMTAFDKVREQDKLNEYIDISQIEIKRLAGLVDKILKMAANDYGTDIVEWTHFDIASTLQNVVQTVRPRFERRQGTIIFEMPNSPVQIQGVEEDLTNVFHNIIENALKYSENNPYLKIQIMEEENRGMVTFEDKGIGIDKSHQARIFDRFYRIISDDHHHVKGYGLGLSYAREVILKHRGEISVESQRGKGSRFIVILPLIK